MQQTILTEDQVHFLLMALATIASERPPLEPKAKAIATLLYKADTVSITSREAR